MYKGGWQEVNRNENVFNYLSVVNSVKLKRTENDKWRALIQEMTEIGVDR